MASDVDGGGASAPKSRPPRVVFRRTGHRVTVTIEGLREVRDRIGHDLLAAFLKCLNGVDRLLTLESLLHRSQGALPRDSVAYTRNLRLCVLFLGSTMYELGEALQELCNARVVAKMRDRTPWEPVNELRGRWRGDARLARLRNSLGFHLGEWDVYKQGLDAMLTRSDYLVLQVSDGEKRHEGEFQGPLEVLLAGLEIPAGDMHAVTKMTQEAHFELPDQLMEVWREVMHTAGIAHVEE